MSGLRRGIAVPPFAEDTSDLIDLGVAAERAGFDGYFLWDHVVWSNTGEGPPIHDPWLILAVVAANTSRIKLGTMVTPVPRRRPWQLAKQTATLDRLSRGRVILGVGIGSPAYGDFGIFGEPTGDRERADRLDEGLDVIAGLWSGEWFSYAGKHFTIDPVRFAPTPVQRPRIPVWVAGELPNKRPIARAARWDGFVPFRFDAGGLVHPSVQEVAGLTGQITALRAGGAGGVGAERGVGAGGGVEGYNMVVLSDLLRTPARVARVAADYQRAGATWWMESAEPRSDPDWWPNVHARVAAGP